MQKIVVTLLTVLLLCQSSLAQNSAGSRPQARQAAGVYPEFRSRFGVIRWLPEQMPLGIYVSPGLCLDNFQDPQLGGPIVNVDNPAAWPPLVARLLSSPHQLNNLPTAPGFSEAQYQAAIQGINMWKPLESPRTFSLQLTNNPAEAVIFVFFTHHLVNKLGLALFANDIRGMTSKSSVPLKAVLAGGRVIAEPVIILVRTCESDGRPLSPDRMKAAVAHEIGHALGIEGHSHNANDLMSIYYGRGTLSASDIATINYLYQLPPDYIPKIGRNLAMPVVSEQVPHSLPSETTNQQPPYSKSNNYSGDPYDTDRNIPSNNQPYPSGQQTFPTHSPGIDSSRQTDFGSPIPVRPDVPTPGGF